MVNYLSGPGAEIIGPIMKSGRINALAFIGSSRVADILKHQHPQPHRLRCILGLDAKNPALILPDADLDLAVKECVTGSLSFNGQRCTALKILFVHESIVPAFLEKFSAAVNALPIGMPWDKDVKLTPLPEFDKSASMAGFVDNAAASGAGVVNPGGGTFWETLYFPAVLYPIAPQAEFITRNNSAPWCQPMQPPIYDPYSPRLDPNTGPVKSDIRFGSLSEARSQNPEASRKAASGRHAHSGF